MAASFVGDVALNGPGVGRVVDLADQPQRRYDARRDALAGDDVAVVSTQRAAMDDRAVAPLGQGALERPVGGLPVEQGQPGTDPTASLQYRFRW